MAAAQGVVETYICDALGDAELVLPVAGLTYGATMTAKGYPCAYRGIDRPSPPNVHLAPRALVFG